jgi:hypothetical protein
MTFSPTWQSMGTFMEMAKPFRHCRIAKPNSATTRQLGDPKSLIVVSQMTTKAACREYRYYLQGRSNDATGPRPYAGKLDRCPANSQSEDR